jgi:hypothetical protein
VLLPALARTNLAIPAANQTNMVASLETRVLNTVPVPNPLVSSVRKIPVSAIVSPTNNPGHPLSPQLLLPRLAQLGYKAILSPSPIPKPRKMETMCDLADDVAELVKRSMNQGNGMSTTSVVVAVPAKGTPSLGTIVIYPQETPSTLSKLESEMLPFSNGLSLWRLNRTTKSHSSFYAIHNTKPPCRSTLSNSTNGHLVVHGLKPSSFSLTLPFNAPQTFTTWVRPSGNTSGLPLAIFTVPNSKTSRISPLQAMAHEFLQLSEMDWMRYAWKPMDFNKWAKRYPPNRRFELERAREWNLASPTMLRSKDAVVTNFLKIETTTNQTDPRNISPRKDEFMVVLGPIVASVEKHAHKAPFLVKGLNLKTRDRRMESLLKYDSFFEIDFARFDMTISQDMLEVERTFILSNYPKQLFPEVHRAYDLMMQTTGISRMDTSYHRKGGRQSGDLTTSIGNGLLNRFAIWACLRNLPRKAWTSFHEGDDGIIGVKSEYVNIVREALQFLWVFGLQPKIDCYDYIGLTSFCGRYLAETTNGLLSYSDPLRTLTKLHTTCSAGPAKELALAKALSYLHTDRETPIIGPWCQAIIEQLRPEVHPSKLKRRINELVRRNELPWLASEHIRKYGIDIHASSSCTVNPELRGVFAMRTGVSVAEQLRFEDDLARWRDRGIDDGIIPLEVTWTIKHNVFLNVSEDQW